MRIYKYSLNPYRTVLKMPRGAKVLTVQAKMESVCLYTKKEAVCIWALVDEKEPDEARSFHCFGTGDKIPDYLPLVYVGTVLMDGGDFVQHVFDSSSMIEGYLPRNGEPTGEKQ